MNLAIRAMVIVVVATTLTCCKKEIEQRNIEQVKLNMQPKEVESILGQPNRTDKADVDLGPQKKTMSITRYYYEQHGKMIAILEFQNGRLHTIKQPDRNH
jgi:hypothetical protein